MTVTLLTFPGPDAWDASWIEPIEPPDGPDAHRPAYHLAGDLTIDSPARPRHPRPHVA